MTTSTSGAPLAIMVRVHGDFTGRVAMIRKIKQAKKPSVRLIYCSYLMTTSEESTEEEPNGGDDSQGNDFISLNRFELLE